MVVRDGNPAEELSAEVDPTALAGWNGSNAAHDCTCMCVYDVSRFPSSVVLDVLATHPVVVMNGRIGENPYYIPAREFIPLLDTRPVSSAALGRRFQPTRALLR